MRRRSRTSLADPPKFDKLGRRIVGPKSPPGLSRFDSSGSANGKSFSSFKGGSGKTSGSSSGAGTPALEEEVSCYCLNRPEKERELIRPSIQPDEDMNRARTLMELFEMRGKFKQMGDTGLTRAKERVDAVVSRYAEKELEEREKVARARHLGV